MTRAGPFRRLSAAARLSPESSARLEKGLMGIILFAVGALIGAAVAYGLWSFLPDTWRPARWPVAIVAGLIVGANFATKITLPEDFGTERALLEDREAGELARAWKAADPHGFAEFIDRFSDARAHGTTNDRINIMRDGISAVLIERLPHLSEADIVALEQNTRDLLLRHADLRPQLCYTLIHRGPLNLDSASMETEMSMQDLARARMAIYANALRANASEHPDAMSAEEARGALTEVGARLRARFSAADVALITARQPPPSGSERKYCEMMAAYEDELSKFPEPGRLYRGLLLLVRANGSPQ